MAQDKRVEELLHIRKLRGGSQPILASAAGFKPTAFQAVSFQYQCWIMEGWSSIDKMLTRYGM